LTYSFAGKASAGSFPALNKYLLGVTYVHQPHASHVDVSVALQEKLWPKIV
jgi:hypothetical protein